MKKLGNEHRHEMGSWLNDRAENSHLQFPRRERAMLRSQQMKTLRKIGSIHASFHNYLKSELHAVDREAFKARRSTALAERQNLVA